MKSKKLVSVVVTLTMTVIFLVAPALVWADNVVEGFYAKGNLKNGDIVTQLAKPANTVEQTPDLESKKIFGVVVDGSSAPITIDRPGEQVFVATGGIYPVLVSDENGPIQLGDYISMSAEAGIGAKATGNQPVVLGQAASTFDGKTKVVESASGHSVGLVKVNIAVGDNPALKNTLAIPSPLQKLGNSIAGAEVSPLKIYISFVIFIIAVSIATILLVVGIRSSLVSLGRNPLSRHVILRGLLQVLLLSLAIFIVSLVGVYLILRL